LESNFIELINESKSTLKDCIKLEKDLEETRNELGSTFEMMLAIFIRFVGSTQSSHGKRPANNRRTPILIPGPSISENPSDLQPQQSNQYSLVNKDTIGPRKEDIDESIYNNLLMMLQDRGRNNHYNPFLPGRYVLNRGHAMPQPAGSRHPEILDSGPGDQIVLPHSNLPTVDMLESFLHKDPQFYEDNHDFLNKRRRLSVVYDNIVHVRPRCQ